MTIQRLLARLASFILLCVLFTQPVFSQTKTITGKVTDAQGVPIVGATVAVKHSSVAVSTKPDGTFSIPAPDNAATLVISSVGYAQQEVAIAGQSSINVLLAASQASLNEVVVIGYGTSRRADVTGSVSTVKAKEFTTVVTTPEQLVVGKVAGVQIAENSGAPGSAAWICRGPVSAAALKSPL